MSIDFVRPEVDELRPRISVIGVGGAGLLAQEMRQAGLEHAVECLLRALEVDPEHQDAPDHLCDVLLALIDELAQIGRTDGFLATQPGGKFDEYNRHIRTRDIGVLIAKIGKSTATACRAGMRITSGTLFGGPQKNEAAATHIAKHIRHRCRAIRRDP